MLLMGEDIPILQRLQLFPIDRVSMVDVVRGIKRANVPLHIAVMG